MRLPLFHNLEGRECLVVGAGTTALRKIRWLLKSKAHVLVVAPDVNDEIRALYDAGQLMIREQMFTPDLVHGGLALVVGATDDKALHATLFELCQTHNVLINCVDDPTHCTVTFPAIVDRSPLIVAISSAAHAPSLARVVRGWIEERLPQNLGAVAQVMQAFRQRVKSTLPDIRDRTHFWDDQLERPWVDAALSGNTTRAHELLSETIDNLDKPGAIATLPVALIGAGPGDPELLTLKGLRYLRAADVVLYDKLANPALLEFARRDAQLIDVGKVGPRPGDVLPRTNSRKRQQHDINDLIVHHAQAGKRVVRLKGGDPFIYGRGGEEIDAVLAAGLEIVAVPGITAALGAASVAGIPLTHRDASQSVRFVTGHRVSDDINLDWPEFAKAEQTLVIYMGLVGLPDIMQKLLEHGCPVDMPVAVVEHATLPEQRILFGNVSTIPAMARKANITGPSVVIVGRVVAMASTAPSPS